MSFDNQSLIYFRIEEHLPPDNGISRFDKKTKLQNFKIINDFFFHSSEEIKSSWKGILTENLFIYPFPKKAYY